MKPTEYHRRIISFLKGIDGTSNVRFEDPRGHGHPALVFNYAGREHRHSVALSPSRSTASMEINNLQRRLRRIDAGLSGWRQQHGDR